jgi:hypothetical protein
VLDHLEDRPPLEGFYREGFTPADARVAAERLVGPYVENRTRLPGVPMELLFLYAQGVATAIRYGKEEALIGSQRIYRSTYRHSPTECLKLFIREQPTLSKARSVFWNLFHLQRDRTELELQEFVHETMNVLGAMLEGVLKPLILALAGQAQLGMRVQPTTMTFGAALDLVAEEFPDVGVLNLSGVRVSQWRNIAQHLSYEVEGEAVVCSYGREGQQIVRLTRDQLNEVLLGASHLWTSLKVGRELFFLDRFDELRREGFDENFEDERVESRLSVLAGGLASQGFVLADACLDASWSKIVVQDMSDMPPKERAVHASQVIFALGEFCPAPMLSVTYRERDGTPSLLVIAPLDVIKQAQESGDLETAGAEMTFVNLKDAPVAELPQ